MSWDIVLLPSSALLVICLQIWTGIYSLSGFQTTSLAFLGLQLAKGRSWHFSASIINYRSQFLIISFSLSLSLSFSLSPSQKRKIPTMLSFVITNQNVLVLGKGWNCSSTKPWISWETSHQPHSQEQIPTNHKYPICISMECQLFLTCSAGLVLPTALVPCPPSASHSHLRPLWLWGCCARPYTTDLTSEPQSALHHLVLKSTTNSERPPAFPWPVWCTGSWLTLPGLPTREDITFIHLKAAAVVGLMGSTPTSMPPRLWGRPLIIPSQWATHLWNTCSRLESPLTPKDMQQILAGGF